MLRITGEGLLPAELRGHSDDSKEEYIGRWRELIAAKEELRESSALRLRVSGVAVRADLEADMEAEDDGHTHMVTLKERINQLLDAKLYLTGRELLISSPSALVVVPWPALILHSLVAKEQPEIYCQVELSSFDLEGETIRLDSDSSQFIELYFTLADNSDTEELYDALCECATLHPSTVSSSFEGDEEDWEGTDNTSSANDLNEATGFLDSEDKDLSAEEYGHSSKLARFEDDHEEAESKIEK